ncbi:MAG: hypothetical protein A2288_01610 [Candidatus Moranbacteria bacterium RIFOXYA12_FULL_44_15]|nr:MAG: hypothetical protein A2288_01610 [Candidatus Moranbacteria bacterium RIFOXYA12_FULL_44_15]OGI34287.1 MAG: hypothetical protein A2259_04440 [Candidatus Moranbacteria bacterium RIFOXYA2_FULL_43_15]
MDLEKLAYQWITAAPREVDVNSEYYCQTRDVYQARYDKMLRELFKMDDIKGDPYVISAVAGEIGNNSFDHNIGNWRDVPGIFFGYNFSDDSFAIVIADRGQGIWGTLKKVKPGLADDKEALKVAFTERISGRAPESRGNGLKFVRENIESGKMHLTFLSGKAKAELNDEMVIEENDEEIRGCLAIIKI